MSYKIVIMTQDPETPGLWIVDGEWIVNETAKRQIEEIADDAEFYGDEG